MKISNIQVSEKRGIVKLTWEFDYKGKLRSVWFELNKKQVFKKNLKSGTSFLCFALLPAMIAEEDVDLNGLSISKRLFEEINKIQDIYINWFPKLKLSKVGIKNFKLITDVKPCGKRIVSLFTGGVDSFDTILQNRKMKNESRIDSLLYVFGLDIHFRDKELINQTKIYIDNVAKALSYETIYVKTNLREFTEKVVIWDFLLAPVFSCIANLFQGYISQLFIPSTTDNEHLFPDGSHPQLDSLFSTENIKIIHYGSERKRIEKILINISRSNIALENLRVCWLNYGGKVNCGVCEKCVRTMIGLEIAGVAGRAKTFTNRLNLEQLEKLEINKPTLRHFYLELFEESKNFKSNILLKLKPNLNMALKHFDKNFLDQNVPTSFKKKNKNIVFFDFNGVLSYNKFWNSLSSKDHELHKFQTQIEEFLFKENK